MLIFYVIIGGLAMVINSFDLFTSDLSYILFIGFSTIVFLGILAVTRVSIIKYRLIFLAYMIRLFVMIFDIYGNSIFVLPNSGDDTKYFNFKATNYALNNVEYTGYSKILGIQYKLFGANRFVGQYFNLLISIATILITFMIIDLMIANNKVKKMAYLLICFLPNTIVLSVILLRESLIEFLITISLFYYLKWWKKNGVINVIIAILFIIAASYLHSGVVFISLGYIICYIFFSNEDRKIKIGLMQFILVIVLMVPAFVAVHSANSFFLPYLAGINSVEDVSSKVSGYELGGSVYLTDSSNLNSLSDLIMITPLRFLYFIISPAPWKWRGFQDILAFMTSSLFYVYTSIKVVKMIFEKDKSNRNLIISIIIILLLVLFVYSWGTSNSGTALRHREKFVSYFILLFAIVENQIKNKNILDYNAS